MQKSGPAVFSWINSNKGIIIEGSGFSETTAADRVQYPLKNAKGKRNRI
jgi:hypothetical protein